MLLEHKVRTLPDADISSTSADSLLLVIVQADPNRTVGQSQDSPLILAVWRGHDRMIKKLLEFKADPNIKNKPQDVRLCLFLAAVT